MRLAEDNKRQRVHILQVSCHTETLTEPFRHAVQLFRNVLMSATGLYGTCKPVADIIMFV